MTHRRTILRWLLLIGLICVAGWVWFNRFHSPAFTIVEVGSRLTSDHLEISSDTIVVNPPKPGVVFATVKKPEANEEFTYVILVKYGRRITSYATYIKPIGRGRDPLHSKLEQFGRWAETGTGFELNGKPIEASYRVELNETRTAVASESLTIAGKPVDMTAGQVFLIDLTAESPGYQQMKVELPAIPSNLATKEDAERAAEAIRKSLESQDPEIKAFLR
jgi:hypothetical protein